MPAGRSCRRLHALTVADNREAADAVPVS